jgi:tetratricopeptide (TPR) repeat protein
MKDTGDPGAPAGGGGTANAGGGGMADSGGGGGSATGASGAPVPSDPPVVFPNQDPDPAQIKSQVEAHLTIARQALSQLTPDPDLALKEAREAIKLEAANVDAAAMIAFAYYHKKQLDTAELVLDDVFKREAAKSNAKVYYVYGLVYDHTKRPEAAVIAYKKAVELDPNYASALVNLAVHQLENKQYAEAQAAFEKLGRNDKVTLTSLASAYRGRSGDYPPGSADRNQMIMKAEELYKRAIATDPNYGPAYYNLGLLYLDSDPFPSGGGNLDTLIRLNQAKTYFDMYQKSPGVEIKLYDERLKDVTKAQKREDKRRKRAEKEKKSGGGGGNP